MKEPATIDEVIALLEEIINDSQRLNNPLGYFATLYHKVTVKVKEGIAANFFDDGPRMEKLDVVFARRYLDAYSAYQNQQLVTQPWEKAFLLTNNYWPIVLQHLLMGINAHINLDLGIAVAEISRGKDIEEVKDDFNKINKILGELVDQVENELAQVWPTLKLILKWTRDADNFLVDFSMKVARNGAWRFAANLSGLPDDQWEDFIQKRGEKVAKNARIVSHPGIIVSFLFGIARLGERGTVGDKIGKLRGN